MVADAINHLYRALDKFGSTGHIYRFPLQRYNEEGEEVSLNSDEVEKIKCKYSIQTALDTEGSKLSLHSYQRRVTIKISKDFEPRKSDIFTDAHNQKFAIDEVWHLVDWGNKEAFYKMKIKTD
jgi:hypothetical protein